MIAALEHDHAQRRALLSAARDGLEAAVIERSPQPIAGEDAGALALPAACFVTLYHGGVLRGCIGTLHAIDPLASVAREMAGAAALRDPRFTRVRPDELEGIRLSITVLDRPRVLTDVREVEIGRDGLIVRRGLQQGVLLPQVASELGWDVETFLAQTCAKAGLPSDAHRDPRTEVSVFRAHVISEV
jgi:AmmeMemoRadiSam system protein A